MHKAWRTTMAVAVCAVVVAGSSAHGSPAGMTISSQLPADSTAIITSPSAATALTRSAPPAESAKISPLRNPVEYFRTAVSKMPTRWRSKRGASNPVVQPVLPRNDSIALSTPTGPPTPELLISVAQLCELQGNVPQARQHYQRALATWPGNVEVLRAAARMEDRQGQLPLAENLYQQAIAANPQHAGVLNDLGLCLARQGKLEASIQMIEQAVHLQPEKALYRNNAATVLVELRQDQKALAHLAAVHGAADANYNLGQLLVQRGRRADAAPYFVAALEQSPGMQAARLALARLQGQDVAGTPTAASQPAVAAETPVPAGSPVVAPPQPASPVGPQFNYPATARSPELGASSYLPPNYYAPTGRFPATVPPSVGPRYLPPVASQPGAVRR